MNNILTLSNSLDYSLSSAYNDSEGWFITDSTPFSFTKNLFKTEQAQIVTSEIGNIFLNLEKLTAPIDYPVIDDPIKDKSKILINKIREDFQIIPLRVAASIEGGIAIIYKKTLKRLFSNKEIEIFIEVYNHGNTIIALIKNSNLIKLDEIDLNNDSSYSTYFKNLQFD